jgi:uncharacterized membrane protein YphA (DoxX/SURF4 family)
MTATNQSNWSRILITILRVAIGWHFLYEGLSKLLMSGWTSQGYLANTAGLLSGFYHWIAFNPSVLKVVDIINVYGLILIGLGLSLGLLVRVSAGAGALLLTIYYFAYPPFGSSMIWSGDGHLFIVDKIFLEALILLVFVFRKDVGYGLENLVRFYRQKFRNTNPTYHPEYTDPGTNMHSRREILKNLATLPLLGALGWGAFRVKDKYGVDVLSGATIQVNAGSLSELKGALPKGRIGKHNMSRLVLGGNLIGGWAHSRDLIYVPSLFRAYNNEKKIYETLMLAESAGIDTINIGFPSNALMEKYKRMTGSKIKVISQVAPNMDSGDYFDQMNRAIDMGADIIQVQGNWCDWLVRDNKPDVIEKMIDKILNQGITAGLGCHTIDALIRCEELGIIPDYYMITMHHDQYWSAHPKENRIPFEVDGQNHSDHNRFHDNMFCLFPERTIEFVNRTEVPVMGFKVLAAGAIKPEDGFKWAFENGADFICVGMFDFQIVNDVNITLDVLANLGSRQRQWYA